MNTTIETMRSHRSIRKFKEKEIPDELLETILTSAQCAATSNFVQAYTIIRVDDQQKRQAIAKLSGFQQWIIDAPVFLVFLADLNRLEAACRKHGKDMASGYMEQFIVATVDTALIGQNTLLAAESMGLGGLFIGAIRNDPKKICDLLNIPAHAYPVFGMCLGYPDDQPPVKPRLPLEAVFWKETYPAQDNDAVLDVYDETTRAYYLSRDSNLKDETWTCQMAGFMSRVVRPHMKKFITSKGFCTR
ncbi:MAG: oxygen-insensitive NADPH nitroreductase [Deltaproteobacteria bacterium]|jgi:nitroreductase|nr:oxygen-insensitive NADPH nitroreductase [Deltaproteobacteria bacterium]